jgi:hypothetical protein
MIQVNVIFCLEGFVLLPEVIGNGISGDLEKPTLQISNLLIADAGFHGFQEDFLQQIIRSGSVPDLLADKGQ